MDYLCQGNFEGTYGNEGRDAYLALDDASGELLGTMYLEEPETQYSIDGGCEQTDAGYANFWLTLVPGGTPYYGTIYEADDGQVYMQGTQDNTGVTFTLQRQ